MVNSSDENRSDVRKLLVIQTIRAEVKEERVACSHDVDCSNNVETIVAVSNASARLTLAGLTHV